jgi:hypothetical protein
MIWICNEYHGCFWQNEEFTLTVQNELLIWAMIEILEDQYADWAIELAIEFKR